MLQIKIMYRIKIGLWALGLAFLFGGCMGVHTSKNFTPPSWFTTPPKSVDFLYGNGSGKTLEESKQNAINDLALSLRVKIDSNISLVNTQENDNQNSKISQNIRLSLKDISLEGLEFSHNEYRHFQYYSQVKVSKDIVAETLKNQYNSLFSELRTFDSQVCEVLSIFDKRVLSKLLEEANSLHETIYTIAPSIRLKSLAKYNEILEKNSPLPKAHLIFLFQDNRDDRAIINAISSEYAKFIKNTDEMGTQIVQNEIFVTNIKEQVKISLQVSFRDCKNKVFLSFQIESMQHVKQDAIARLKVQLYKKLIDYASGDKSSIPKLY